MLNGVRVIREEVAGERKRGGERKRREVSPCS